MKKIVFWRKLMALVCGIMVFSLIVPTATFAQRAGGNNAAQQQQQRQEQERLEQERLERERQDRERQDRERREREERERYERERREREERERQALRVQMPTGSWLIQTTQVTGNDGYWDLDGTVFVPGVLVQINNGQTERVFGNVFTFVAVSAWEPGWYYIRDGQGHGVGVPGNKDANGVNLMVFAAANEAFQQFRVEWNDAGNAFRLYTRSGKPVAVDANRNGALVQTTDRARDNQLWWRLVQVGSSRRSNHSIW
jgi:hypothetical protein